MSEQGGKRKQEAKPDTAGDKAAKKAKFFSTNKDATLPLGTRGILISCVSNKWKPAAQEAIRVLTPYYEELLPATKAEEDSGKDISSLIANEIADLKNPRKQVFTVHDTGIPSLVYLEMAQSNAGPGPSEVMLAVAQDIQKTRQCKVRLCMRFTPVLAVCQADLGEVKQTANRILGPLFPAEATQKKFAVVYEHRASAKLDRMAVVNAVAEDIPQPPHKADLSNPEVTIVVSVVKDVCAIGVASQFRELLKYNLRELCNEPDEKQKPTAAAPAKAVEVSKAEVEAEVKAEASENAAMKEGAVVNGKEECLSDVVDEKKATE